MAIVFFITLYFNLFDLIRYDVIIQYKIKYSGSSKAAAPPAVFEVLKDVLEAKEKAENILMDYYTNSNWSIVRPGGLVSEVMTGEAILTEDTTTIGSIHREDVADLVIKVLDSTNTERKVLSAVDPSIASSVAVDVKVIPAFVL
ncbi:MAG: hypothetical protein ACI8RD_014242 [Bacillariaceae sp.]|jgi:hypothetical protein